ncbi:MAG: ferrous iron transport protein, partial [Bacteroidota bacterium]
MTPKRALRVALVGRPNTGKSSLFNRLTGLNQKVGNYPGVTMEKHLGLAKIGSNTLAEVIDLPGVYSSVSNGNFLLVAFAKLRLWIQRP